MAQILVQIDSAQLKQLNRVAPPRSRKRSQFIRLAIAKALMDLQDLQTREAYRRQPQEDSALFSAEEWSRSLAPRRGRKL